MADLFEKVQRDITYNKMIEKGDKILAGVSGGADSTCLLVILGEMKRKGMIDLAVVHINHLIRSDASDDANYVKKLCDERNIPFYLEEINISAMAKELSLTEEEAGRQARYQTFEKIAKQIGANKIAVAHNLNDKAETMLLNLFRGSGLHGAAGIRPIRDNIVRPLLGTTRSEIEQYLRQKNISFQTDSTNLEDEHTRNRIRHNILPVAQREVNAQAIRHICNTADDIAAADEFITEYARGAYERCLQVSDKLMTDTDCRNDISSGSSRICFDLKLFLQEKEIIRNRMLLMALSKLTPHNKDISKRHIELISSLTESMDGSSKCSLPYGIEAQRQYDRLIIYRKEIHADEDFDEIEISFDANSGGYWCGFVPGTGKIEAQIIEYGADRKIPTSRYTKWFDYDRIQESLRFRVRMTGDYLMCSRDNDARQSLKKYMINEKIPEQIRNSMYVLADGSHIMWVPGYRTSCYYYVDENTRHILEIRLIDGGK